MQHPKLTQSHLAILILNLLKCICILVVTLKYREPTLSTIGDAVCSFLKDRDSTTAQMGVVTKDNIVSMAESDWMISGTCKLTPQTVRMYRAASVRRWIVTISA
jgi:hypothetical protein